MVTARDGAFTALIFGFFGLAWFGWAQASATTAESIAFGIGWALSLALLIVAGIAVFRRRRGPGSVNDPTTGRRFGIIVGIEFGLAFVGAAVLGANGQQIYIPAWIALVVGAHFVPLIRLFGDPDLRFLAGVMCACAVAAAVLALVAGTPTSTTAAPAAGLALLVYGTRSLLIHR